MGLGVDTQKSKKSFKKTNKQKNPKKIIVSHPLFPKKENVFAPFQMRTKKNPIDKQQWVTVFVNTSFFVIYSSIQAAKVLIAVCHFSMSYLSLHIYGCNDLFIFMFVHFSPENHLRCRCLL